MLRFLADFSDIYGPLRVMDSITFRAILGVAVSFLVTLLIGKSFIRRMLSLRATEDVSKPHSATLERLHAGKQGTPTMGGLLVLLAMLVTILLVGDVTNFFVIIGAAAMICFGALGYADDYVKLKGLGKQGLGKRQKLACQVALASLIALAVWACDATGRVKVRDVERGDQNASDDYVFSQVPHGMTAIMVPFTKWSEVRPSLGAWYYFFFVVVIVSCANAVNLTDGLDGLASGCTIMVAVAFAVLAYMAGNATMAWFFRIPFVMGSGELTVLCAAMVGAVMGFLWFNAHPAEVFLGDTGSLSLGATIAYVALMTKHELVLPLAGGIFVIEALSVLMQMASFRLTGRRIFKCAPLHHHLEFAGWHENKVVVRLWMIGVILAALAMGTLKMH